MKRFIREISIVVIFVGAALALSFLLFPRQAKSAEYESFVTTPMGPQIKGEGACEAFGGTLGGFIYWRTEVHLTYQAAKASLNTFRVSGDQELDRMVDFMERELDIVYQTPLEDLPGAYEYAARWQSRCNELEGRTWLF